MDNPKRIRILGKYYKVVTDSRPISEVDNYGLMEIGKCLITLAENQDPQQQRDTLLHECIHGIEDTMGLNLTEEQVLGLGSGVYALLTENPKLVKWIMESK